MAANRCPARTAAAAAGRSAASGRCSGSPASRDRTGPGRRYAVASSWAPAGARPATATRPLRAANEQPHCGLPGAPAGVLQPTPPDRAQTPARTGMSRRVGAKALLYIPVGQQVQILVEQLPVQLRAWQALPAALAENAQHHFSRLHCASFMVTTRSSPVPLRPVVRVSRSPDWTDVTPPTTYGHSVAIGLASLRRSHVHIAIRGSAT